MIGLLTLHLGNDLHILFRLIEGIPLHLLHIIVGSLEAVLSPLELAHLSIDVLIEPLSFLISCLVLLLKGL